MKATLNYKEQLTKTNPFMKIETRFRRAVNTLFIRKFILSFNQ